MPEAAALDAVNPGNMFHDNLAALVRDTGPLTPEIMSAWIRSGVCVPEETWDRHLQIVLDDTSQKTP
jgi:hypothetical protein